MLLILIFIVGNARAAGVFDTNNILWGKFFEKELNAHASEGEQRTAIEMFIDRNLLSQKSAEARKKKISEWRMWLDEQEKGIQDFQNRRETYVMGGKITVVAGLATMIGFLYTKNVRIKHEASLLGALVGFTVTAVGGFFWYQARVKFSPEKCAEHLQAILLIQAALKKRYEKEEQNPLSQ